MSINRRPLHFLSLMLLLLVAFALRQQSSSEEADSAVASVAPSSELAPEVHSVTVVTVFVRNGNPFKYRQKLLILPTDDD